MESENLNPGDPRDSRLEDLLRASAPAALPDDGFAGRVLAALPRSSPVPWRARESVIVTLAGAAGLMFALAAGGGATLGSLAAAGAAFAAQPGVLVGLAVCGGLLALADEIESVF
jgi:hypothetical protein